MFCRPLLAALVGLLSLPALAARINPLTVPSAARRQSLWAALGLGGGRDNVGDWLTKVPNRTILHRLTDQHNLIIVRPDGDMGDYRAYTLPCRVLLFSTTLPANEVSTLNP